MDQKTQNFKTQSFKRNHNALSVCLSLSPLTGRHGGHVEGGGEGEGVGEPSPPYPPSLGGGSVVCGGGCGGVGVGVGLRLR